LSTPDEILIVGGDSFIGMSLAKSLEENNLSFNKTSRQSSQDSWYLDLSVDSSIVALIAKVKEKQITHIVFLAGITSEKECKNAPELAEKINVTNTCRLLDAFNKLNIFIVFLSSSQVFNHQQPFIPWNESYSPTTLYGEHKVKVEQYIKANISNASIVRLTKVIGHNFTLFEQIISKAENKQEIELFGNYCAAPVSLVFVNHFLSSLLIMKSLGVFQLSGNEDLSYAEMARQLLLRQFMPGKIKSVLAQSKGITPTPYGSLQMKSYDKFKADNQSFSEVLDDYFSVT
jgi:dTDP-4-dehydrorhamnose reductase